MTRKSGQVYRISPKGRRKDQYYSKSSYILKAFGQKTGQPCLHRQLTTSKDMDSSAVERIGWCMAEPWGKG